MEIEILNESPLILPVFVNVPDVKQGLPLTVIVPLKGIENTGLLNGPTNEKLGSPCET